MILLIAQWVREKIISRNPFELGISLAAYYALVFFVIPLLSFAGLGVVGVIFRWDVWGVAFLGIAGMILGYWGIGSRVRWRGYRIFKEGWDLHRAKIVFFISFCLGFAAKLIRVLGGGYNIVHVSPLFSASQWYSVVGVLDLFGPIALLLAWCIVYMLRSPHLANSTTEHSSQFSSASRWKWISWGLLAVELVYAIPTCKRLSLIVPLLLVLIVQSFLSRMSWIKIGFVFAGILFPVFPLGNLCRNPGAFLEYSPQSLPSGEVQRGPITPHISPLFIVESFLSRLNYYHLMGYIIDANDPPLLGKHFSDFFVSFGPPRFLWKTKPIIGIDGNAFGRHIGILNSDDMITSVGPNIVGDLYMNFRIFGVFFGMMFLGLLWRYVYEVLIVCTRTRASLTPSLSGIFLYAFLWVQLMRGFEDPLAPMYAGLIKIFIILLLLVWFLCGKKDSVNNPQQ